MTKLMSALALFVCGVAAVAVVAPVLTRLAGALVPLVLVLGFAAALVRAVWAYTRRW
jgi:hypothetical protein